MNKFLSKKFSGWQEELSCHKERMKQDLKNDKWSICKYIANGLVALLFAISFLMLFFTALRINKIVSIFYYLSFLFSFILLGVQLVFSIKKKENILLMILSGALIVLSCIAPIRLITIPSKLKKYIFFLSAIALLFSAIVGEWLDITKKTILICAQLAALTIICVFIFSKPDLDIDGNVKYNFDSAVKAGIFLNVYSMILTIGIFYYKKLSVFIINLCLIIFLSILIWPTKCRNAMLSQLIFIILVLGFSFKWFFKPYFYIPIIVSGMLVVGFFCLAYQYNWFGEITILGKHVFARASDYWIPSLQAPFKNLLFGNYAHYIGPNGQNRESFQMHNLLMDVLISYGILSVIMFVVCISFYFHNFLKTHEESKLTFVCGSAFLMIFITGWFEAMFVAGGLCYYIMALAPLFIARTKPKQTNSVTNIANS